MEQNGWNGIDETDSKLLPDPGMVLGKKTKAAPSQSVAYLTQEPELLVSYYPVWSLSFLLLIQERQWSVAGKIWALSTV